MYPFVFRHCGTTTLSISHFFSPPSVSESASYISSQNAWRMGKREARQGNHLGSRALKREEETPSLPFSLSLSFHFLPLTAFPKASSSSAPSSSLFLRRPPHSKEMEAAANEYSFLACFILLCCYTYIPSRYTTKLR